MLEWGMGAREGRRLRFLGVRMLAKSSRHRARNLVGGASAVAVAVVCGGARVFV